MLHPFMNFQAGSFDEISVGRIACVIMVNFIHGISPKDMRSHIQDILDKNEVQIFVIDVIRRSGYSEYCYEHDGSYLFGDNYYLLKRSKRYRAANGAVRYVEYWKKRKMF